MNKNHKRKNCFIALSAVCLFAATASNAASLQWTFDSSLSFSDGTSITGSFLYDADTQARDFTNLTVACSSICTDTLMDPVIGLGDGFPSSTWFGGNDAFNEDIEVYISWSSTGLTNAGGTVSMLSATIYNLDANTDAAAIPSLPTVTASVVPLPAAAWLFGSALAGLGWMRRRKTA